ncbi:MAG TPA: type VI secretion system tip protein TssI/VgrG [Bryobacteraceae bacterium]|nr:type VI secretion system tip protein TssI/VgrG [Bryobacteraceae bacterium]
MQITLSQKLRLFHFDSPLGEDKLLVNKFSGAEKISELFKFDLELVSTDFSIQTEQMLGQNVTVGIRHIDGENFRYFNGHISKFAPIRHDGRLAYYQAEMVPWLWFLSLTQGCHIYQEKTLVEVITDTFNHYGYKDFNFNVTDRHKPWENCCQYQESAFEFVSRLLEIEGMYYFFKHEQGKHTMMIVDHMSSHTPCPFQSAFSYEHETGQGALRNEDTILSSNMRKIVKPNKYAHKDYNFKIPQNPLEITKKVQRDTGVDRELEVYDYPGEYELPGDVTDWGDLRMEEQETDHTIAEGTGTGRSMVPGYRFQLKQHDRPEQNIDYLLVSVTHKGQEGSFGAGMDDQDADYTNSYVAQPSSVQFRPTMKTDEPKIASTQTAFVVGPPGEEIYTDEWGRVRVKFHWDRRKGDENGNSSCWIRVMQPWGGPRYGHIWIPRVGMEVIVTFLEGDPDRPLITGCVYHQNNRPPYPLPANKEWSGVKTRSTKGGTQDNYNEIRLVDSMGQELFRMQAERDLHIFVKNDRSEYILNDRFLDVGNDKHERIENNKYTDVSGDFQENIDGKVKVQIGDDATLAISGDQTEEVEGDKNITVDGDFAEDIQGDTSIHNEGDLDQQVDGDGRITVTGDLHIKSSGKLILEADGGLTVKCGDAFFDINDGIITIQGKKILLNCGGSADDADAADPDDPDTPEDFDNPDDPRFQSPAGDFPLPDKETPEPDASTDNGAALSSSLGADGGSSDPFSGGSNPYADAESLTGTFDPDASTTGSSDPLAGNPWVAQAQGILGQVLSQAEGVLGQAASMVEQAVTGEAPPASSSDPSTTPSSGADESQVSGTPDENPDASGGDQGVA